MSSHQVQTVQPQISALAESNQSATLELLQRCGRAKSRVQESGKPLTLRVPLSATEEMDVNRSANFLARTLSTPQTTSGIVAAYERLFTMPGKSLTVDEAEHERSIWIEDLTNIDDTGIIPDEIMMRVSRAFTAGKHGKFMPSSGEFINQCKEYLKPFQRQLYDLRRFQSAVVERPEPTGSDYAARKACADEVRSALGLDSAPTERVLALREKWSPAKIGAKYGHLPTAARMKAMMADIDFEHKIAARDIARAPIRDAAE